jgi:ribonuclease Z
VKELVLTHLIPGHLPDHRWLDAIERSEFNGDVTVGRDLLQVCSFGQ